jgi:hypothetical protein
VSVASQLARRGGPWIARRVRDADDAELERLLRSRAASGVLLWAIFKAMPARIRQGTGLDATVEWRVRRAGDRLVVRRLVLGAGTAWVERPAPGALPADLTLSLDDLDFVRLAAGDRSVTYLVLRGRLTVEGSRLLAARLMLVLDPPVPSRGDGRAARRRPDRPGGQRGGAGPGDRDPA